MFMTSKKMAAAVLAITVAMSLSACSNPTQPSEREWDEMRRELQGLKRQLAEQEAERNAQKQNGSSKQKTPVIP